MKIYRKSKKNKTALNVNTGYEAEMIERKIERMVNNNEQIDGMDNVPLIFTERKEGVGEAYNVRTDRFEVAIEATDRVHKGRAAKRQNVAKAEVKDEKGEGKSDGGAEPTDG